ncbi:methyl-accepting chemotaxis protein [Clostridium ganghwense]|uniref:Methyl-accepting chemotaxis protein n=1 Tax=Clostridium ganghwense TaxID=312089 RepID=A0ABT4CND6_9CLOT|nr:methyl-accepting chemotaxis protein [Clostridium ganghwense]MCY6369509.1 methyl-accepting chemotaxis protein [Clostridium ganghwense]
MLRKLKKMKVTTAMYLMLIISFAFISIVGLKSYVNMKKMNTIMCSMYHDVVKSIEYSSLLRDEFLNIRIFVNKANANYNSEYDTKIKELDKKIQENIKEYTAIKTENENKKKLNDFKESYLEYIKLWSKNNNSLKKGQKFSYEDYKNMEKLGTEIENNIAEIRDYDFKYAEIYNSRSEKIYHETLIEFALIYGFLIVIMIVISYFTVKLIKNGSRDMIEKLNIMAEGDFTFKIDSEGKNEFAVMKKQLDVSIKKISNMMRTIKEKIQNVNGESENLASAAEQMATSSENVSIAIQDTAKGTASQAEDLVTITNILNKFGEELENIVGDIEEVDSNSREMGLKVSESNNDMKNLIESLNEIINSFNEFIIKISGLGDNINQITEITKLINSIAEQTNLLALNAAIEAARAGESGKGFAVVADEIRKLAEETKISSHNINSLIDNISNDTNTMLKTTELLNSQLNNQTEILKVSMDSFNKIIKGIEEISPKIDRVSVSALSINKEKNAILERIENSSAIAEQVSASAQQIAASSEEMSASSQEVASIAQTLSSEAQEMLEEVNQFKL